MSRTTHSSTHCRRQLLDFFHAGVEAVKGDNAVRHYFSHNPKSGCCHVIAVGKAASAMLCGALGSLPSHVASGLLITKHGHVDASLRTGNIQLEIIESSHPVPGSDSLYAGERLLAFIESTPIDAQLLVLISGGTSSLVEVLPEGMTLADLQSLNDTLLASGMDIGDMNRVRKAVSRIKGGRLAGFLGDRCVTCLLLSDVPGDRFADIGSGLLCREESNVPETLPASLSDFVQASSADAVDPGVWGRIDTHIVASLGHAKVGAANAAQAAGYTVGVDQAFLQGDAVGAGNRVAQQLKDASPGVYVWGGETTIKLPVNPGRGGRNQHLALAAAAALQGVENCYLLCAGTDGTDGPTGDAGGVVDGGSIQRGCSAGLQYREFLNAANSGDFLSAAGDLVTTGPTGTNVMDLVIGMKV